MMILADEVHILFLCYIYIYYYVEIKKIMRIFTLMGKIKLKMARRNDC
jgi:hypothetical protein